MSIHTHQTENINPHAMYRARDCARFFAIGLSSWWRWVAEERVQRPLKLGPRTSVWQGSYLIALRDRLVADAQREG